MDAGRRSSLGTCSVLPELGTLPLRALLVLLGTKKAASNPPVNSYSD
jgi:hypothetical protein